MEATITDLINASAYGQNGVPHELWTHLRKESPVYWYAQRGHTPFWAITKHEDIMEVSSQPDIFSNEAGGIIVLNEAQIQSFIEGGSGSPLAQMKTIITMDPPEHRSYRKVASGYFTPRGVTNLDEIVKSSAAAIFDELPDEGEVDFIETIAQKHPLRVLATILGINEEQEERLLVITQELFGGEDPDMQRQGEDREAARKELGMEFYMLFDEIIKDRRACPRDDLATMLANAELSDGCPLGQLETLGYYLIVFTAGHDTTRNALSGAISAFLDHPDQFERLRQDPSLSKSAVDEIVRWTTPVNYMKRQAVQDYELRGQKIKAGEELALFYCSANRDEDVFEDPFTFDIGRSPNRHLGFGWAEHYCLGAHLAKASMKALTEEMVRRIDWMEPNGERTFISSNFVVGLKTLPVKYKLKNG
ncbi:MAG: cytochrome P450 [Acidimicrobiaceae bacterium]|nr:cytochrome P450 [Acidimicrobiaceae bacterium]MEC7152634.1 cytochrome P450 [Actinomycetota bacterium]MEC8118845.1 cytochrome P450 [Actinomycetota bacterium]MEC9210502.1 cytochrome P450 [Actinomycetota bacterium]|tara:strand:+ start:1670 stop:2926 length:1257 start_codon:yes stop_codon:yes gene_type:complete